MLYGKSIYSSCFPMPFSCSPCIFEICWLGGMHTVRSLCELKKKLRNLNRGNWPLQATAGFLWFKLQNPILSLQRMKVCFKGCVLKVHIQENMWYSYISSSFCYIDSIKEDIIHVRYSIWPWNHVFLFRRRWIASGHFENISNWNSDLWRYASSFIIHTNLHININLCIQTFKAQIQNRWIWQDDFIAPLPLWEWVYGSPYGIERHSFSTVPYSWYEKLISRRQQAYV
jgi:hypothetical protein